MWLLRTTVLILCLLTDILMNIFLASATIMSRNARCSKRIAKNFFRPINPVKSISERSEEPFQTSHIPFHPPAGPARQSWSGTGKINGGCWHTDASPTIAKMGMITWTYTLSSSSLHSKSLIDHLSSTFSSDPETRVLRVQALTMLNPEAGCLFHPLTDGPKMKGRAV